MKDRRVNPRVEVELPTTQYVDNTPVQSQVSNLSAEGMHTRRVVGPISRSSRLLQVEIKLPGLGEPLWAKGEVVYDAIGPRFHETGIRFVAMAPGHRGLLRSWLDSAAQPPWA